jgi:DNA-binding NtrC family response regulator
MIESVDSIFIVDDDKTQASMMQDYLSKNSTMKIHVFNSGEDCLKNLSLNPQVVFLDYNFDKAGYGSVDGLSILKQIKSAKPATEVVMVSGQDKIEVAVNVMKYGAFDYIIKSESAFHRADNAIFNIIKRMKLAGEARLYKRLTFGLAIGLIIMLIVVFLLYRSGHITDSPGWY